MRRCIGLDVHREFAEVAIWEDGIVRSAGQITTTPEALRLFGESLQPTDQVVVEATGNAVGIARILEPFVERVVLADAKAVRAAAKGPRFHARPVRQPGGRPKGLARATRKIVGEDGLPLVELL
jgi:hypothetical protein